MHVLEGTGRQEVFLVVYVALHSGMVGVAIFGSEYVKGSRLMG